MASKSQRRRERRAETARNLPDREAFAEAKAIRLLQGMVPRRLDAGITASIHWAPKTMGENGRFVPRKHSSRGPMIRGKCHRTPKLVGSYVRCFG
jgi:hypothetical protein